MMPQNASEIIEYAANLDIKLVAHNDKLVIDAPKGQVNTEFRGYLIKNKQQILEILLYQGFTLKELQEHAGEDWQDIKDNKEALGALANLLAEQKLIHSGEIPARFTARAYCTSCASEVPLPPALTGNGKVFACIWCWNRAKGLPVPSSVENIKKFARGETHL